MKKFFLSAFFIITVFVIIVGFIQINTAYAIGPCDGICYESPGVCNPDRAQAACYCPGTSHLITCAVYCPGESCEP